MRLMHATAALVAAVIICAIGYLGSPGNSRVTLASAPETHAGPACTPAYPRGFKVPAQNHSTKKGHRPSPTCINGDLQSTWGACVPRFNA